MLNAEKFKDELLEILSENRYIEVDKYDRKIRKCTGNNCPKCMFGITALGKGRDSCSIAAMLWLLSEYKEPVKLTRLEYLLLKLFYEKDFRYLTRGVKGYLYIHKGNNPPQKKDAMWLSYETYISFDLIDDLFQFVKWSDEKPYAIKDILENCEVVEDAEE